MTKRSLALIGSLLFAVACPGEEEPTDTTDTPTPECATISSSFPQDEATNVYYRVTLSWEFTEADTSAAVTVTGAAGDVAGSSAWIGNTLIWEADAPLDPSASYDVSLTYCDGANNPMTSFTTSAVGASVDLADLADKTFALDVEQGSSAIFIQPPGVGPVLQQQLDENDIDILIGVQDATDTNITLMGALGDGGATLAQDLCAPSIPFPTADFTANPYFTVGPQDVTFDVADVSLTLMDLNVDGAFGPGGTLIAGATLSGTLNVNDLVPLAGPDGDAVCELAEPFGVFCEACEDGSGNYCLSALVTNIEADLLSGVSLVERTEAQIDADTTCVEEETTN